MIFAGLSKSGMISDHGGCRTYHDDADGYARGEGVGMVVLKRLDDAVAENDNILGIIRGSGRTYTTTSTSITHPDSQSQVRLYQEIMRQTAVVPNEIAYVEMHGTGTQAGDVEEMKSVIQVLSQQRSKTNILTVGAVKANVGHGEGAAGVTSLIKVLMMMAEKKIPPQPGYPFKLNRNFPNLEASHVRIAGVGSKDLTLRSSPTSRNGKIKCLVSSFDASGGNTALLVEEAPTRPRKAQNLLKCHPITLSAKTPASLQRNQERLLEFLTRFPSTNLADLAYTTSARRMHEVLRVAYAGQTTKDIMISLRESLAKGTASTIKKPKPSCIAFMFTGQGSQYAGMGRQYYAQSSTFRELLQTYQTICEHQGLPRFLHVISDTNADMAHLSTVAAQLAIVALELGITHLFRSWGIEPKLVIGHSLGEYSALCVAGVLSVSDTFHLVGRRAQLMEQKLTANEYSMLAVHESLESTLRLLATDGHALDHTEVACVNAPQITVVSGPAGEIKHLQSALQMQGSKSTILRTSYGFHSRHIHPVLEDLGRIAQSIHFSPPKIPVISTLLGRIVEAGEGDVFSSSYLVRQARERVQFSGALQAYKEHSLAKMQAFWLEVGPEPTCIGLARKSLDASSNRFLCTAKSTEDNWASASQALAALWQSGASVDWPQYYKPFSNTVQLLKIPTYAFDEKSYWKPYVQRSSSNPQHSVELKNNASIASKTSSPAFQTTSLQWIENEVLDGDSISVTFASRTSDTDLYDAIQGHTVNGVAIVSMSMFGDMAKSAARYAYEKLHPAQQPPNMTIEDLDMTHALVVQLPNPDQVVHTSISYTRGSASFVTFSSSTKGDAQKDHGSLRLVFEDTSNWFSQQNQMSFLVNARIHSLKELATKGDAHHLLKPIIYRLFSNLVSYGSHYKAMEEAWVDRQCRDAASTIRLSSSTGNGRFLYNPFWSDGAVHLGGFLLNAGLTDDEDSVSLCTGLGCWRSLHDLRGGETYTTYAAIEESSTPHMLTGSAYVFDSEQKLVQVATGMRFHKMKRITLGAILGTPQATAVPAAQPLTKPSQWLGNTLTIPNLGVLTPASTIGGDDFDRGDYIGNTTFQTQSTSQTDDNMKTFLSIVTSECGCSEAELDQNTLFADIGVDSLMAITIFATFRKQTGIELPVTFFLDHESIAEARAALSGPSPGCSSPTSSESELDEPFTDDPEVKEPNVVIAVTQDDSEGLGVEIDAQEEAELLPGPKEEPVKIAKPSQVVLLNGNPSSKGRKLFLLPDGSGSPGGFIQLPPLDASLNTYAVQSPFSKCPAEYTCTMEEICGSFLEAIKTVQSEGPYMIGGYSFGALYAYEVTRMLCERGEQVHGLFIIDMAVPNHTNTHVDITQQSLTDAGLAPMMGMMTAASKEHQLNTIRAMFPYVPTPCISPTQPRKTVLIFTKDGLTSGKQCELALWAQGNSSPTRGWETLINGPLVRKDVGGTHFALLRYPAVRTHKS
jgi:iterative type I PKS product template protein